MVHGIAIGVGEVSLTFTYSRIISIDFELKSRVFYCA